MPVLTRHFKWFVLILLLVFVVLTTVVYADNVQNNVTAGGNDTMYAGGSTVIHYRITAVSGDGLPGCNAAPGSAATVTILTPAEVNASPNPLVFTACGAPLPSTFTSTTPGNYVINVSVSDPGAGTYNTNPASFTLHVLPPLDTTPPVITPVVAGTSGNDGWYVSNVDVSWIVSDPESTISSSTGCEPSSVTEDTAGVTFTCSATSAGGTSSQSVTIKRDATAPTISGSASPNVAWTNQDVTVSFECNDAMSGVASCTLPTTLTGEGANQSVMGTAEDNAGNSAEFTVGGINIDKTAPIVSAAASPLANAFGWNNSDVTVSFTCSDGLSGIAGSCPSPVAKSGEGANQSASSGDVFDLAGNVASTTLANINIDKTAPSIIYNVSGTPGNNGWYISSVLVGFSCDDALSGIDSCSPDATLTDGMNLSATGTAVDKAGNSASTSATGINIDTLAPLITGSRSPSANANGWNNTDVTVTFSCAAGVGSPLFSCSPDQLFGEGANQSATGFAMDEAGNTASATIGGINVDKTPPTITGAATIAPNEHGWYNDDVILHFTCADALSGVDDTTCQDVTVTSEGLNQSGTGSVTDLAGNTNEYMVDSLNIDKTAPTISRSITGTAGNNGWYISDVTASYTCADVLSDIASCTADQPFGDGANQAAAGTATDMAGNVASTDTLLLNVDTTAPVVTGSRTPDANEHGWNNGDVTVSFECIDALSGIVECPLDTVVSTEGADQFVDSGLVYDAAGNSSSALVNNINIDKTAPIVTGSRTPDANANGWNNSDVTVSFTCSDAVSAIVACPPPTVVSAEGDNLSVDSGPVYDLAGNSSSDVVDGINIDKTAPIVTGSRTPLANGDGWNNEAVTVSFTCSDADGSGVVPGSCPEDTTLSGEGAGQSVYSGLVYDLADNSSDATVIDINIDLTNPTITGSAAPGANLHGWNNTDVTVTFSCNDALSGIKTCTAPVILTGEVAGQSASGTATDEAGNSADTTVSGINIDKTAPVVAVTGIANGDTFILGSVPVAGCTTSDALSGVDVNATISTQETDGLVNGVGTFMATCAGALDKAGNAGSASVDYTVTYNFSGFFAPVDNLPTVNTVRAGSAVPIKFSLGGNYGLNILQGNATIQSVQCNNSAPTDAIESTVTAGNSSLSYDAATGQYTYVWKTTRGWSGCRRFTITLNDGTQHVAIFNFR